MRGIKTDIKKLILEYGDQFTKLYLSGVSINNCAPRLGISESEARILKDELKLPVLKWQKLNLPVEFTNNTISLIYGALLGDAHLASSGQFHTLNLGQCIQQRDYLEYKRQLLCEIKPYDIKLSGVNFARFMTAPHPHLSEVYKTFYNESGKQVSREILNKLTPEAIALWFMDDGSITPNKNGLSIATCSFNDESIYNIISFFQDTFDVTVKVYYTNNIHPKIYMFGDDAIKFKHIIEPYIISSMKYKINLGKGTGTRKKWSKEDIEYLQSNIEKPRLELSSILNRSIDAVYYKIKEIKNVE